MLASLLDDTIVLINLQPGLPDLDCCDIGLGGMVFLSGVDAS